MGQHHAQPVELRLQDYRHLSETYDHIVSIEMLEAVGEAHWEAYSHALKRCLKPRSFSSETEETATASSR